MQNNLNWEMDVWIEVAVFNCLTLKVFYKKAVLKTFAKLTGKHLYQSLFINKVAGL